MHALALYSLYIISNNTAVALNIVVHFCIFDLSHSPFYLIFLFCDWVRAFDLASVCLNVSTWRKVQCVVCHFPKTHLMCIDRSARSLCLSWENMNDQKINPTNKKSRKNTQEITMQPVKSGSWNNKCLSLSAFAHSNTLLSVFLQKIIRAVFISIISRVEGSARKEQAQLSPCSHHFSKSL